MKRYISKKINKNITIKYELDYFELLPRILFSFNCYYGCREIQIGFLWFAIRFLFRDE